MSLGTLRRPAVPYTPHRSVCIPIHLEVPTNKHAYITQLGILNYSDCSILACSM